MTKPLASGIIARSTGYNIDPRRVIKRVGWNTRFDLGDIESLAASIETELQRDPGDGGLLNAVRVKRITGREDVDFEIVDGERRMTAIWHLLDKGVVFPEGIKATLVDKKQDDVTSLIQMYTANTGKAFLPLEEAAAFKRMRDAGMTIAQICKAVGRADVHVIDTLALVDADEDLQAAVASGAVGGTMAKVIATTARGNKALQKELTAEAKEAKGKGAEAKAAKGRLLKKLQDTKDAKAKAKGKTLKIRALTDEQLSALGEKVAALLAVKAQEAKWAPSTDVNDFVAIAAKDEALAAGYTLGLLMGLRAAAGLQVTLDI